MPRMNGSGPEGKGPKTGRGSGRCAKTSNIEAFENSEKGRGKRRKAGGGQGKGNRFQSGLK